MNIKCVFISVFNQLDAQNLFHNKFISCLYMFRAHVRIITASGIITPIGVMMCVLTLSTNFLWDIYHSKKNSEIHFRKCT